jgi:hypothetical protein
MKDVLSARPLSATISRLFLYAQVVPAKRQSQLLGAGQVVQDADKDRPVGGGGLGVAKPNTPSPSHNAQDRGSAHEA